MDNSFYIGRINIFVPDWLTELVFNIVVELAKFFTLDLVKRLASNTTEEFWYSVFVLGSVAMWIFWIKKKLEEIILDETD